MAQADRLLDEMDAALREAAARKLTDDAQARAAEKAKAEKNESEEA